jgi:hypothetical protein
MTLFNSSFNGAQPFSDLAPQFSLAANVELTFTVPGSSAVRYRIEFACPYNANIWIGYNVTATSPTPATMSSGTRVELMRSGMARFVKGGDVLHFTSNSIVTDAGMSLLQLPA